CEDFFFCENGGLVNGQLGLCINLYEWGRFVNDASIIEKADNLIESIISSLNIGSAINPQSVSMGFSHGLLGMGWGIEYLAQRAFVENNTNDILLDLDERSFLRRFTGNDANLSFQDNFLGVGYYYTKRLQNPIAIKDENNTQILKIRQNLVTYIAEHFGRKEQILLSKETLVLPNVIAVLASLYKLDIFNHKIVRTFEWYSQNIKVDKIQDQLSKVAMLHSLVGVHNIEDPFCKEIFTPLVIELKNNLDSDKLLEEFNSNSKIFDCLKHITYLEKNKIIENDALPWKKLSVKWLKHNLSDDILRNKQAILDMGLLNGFNGFRTLIPIIEKEI
ncbi:MAG: hypothetical protein DI598_12190, partial [Pseudopedobacter saltans]